MAYLNAINNIIIEYVNVGTYTNKFYVYIYKPSGEQFHFEVDELTYNKYKIAKNGFNNIINNKFAEILYLAIKDNLNVNLDDYINNIVKENNISKIMLTISLLRIGTIEQIAIAFKHGLFWVDEIIYKYAVEVFYDKIDILKIIFNDKYEIDRFLMYVVINGDLEYLKSLIDVFMKNTIHKFVSKICLYANQYGQLEIVKYMHENIDKFTENDKDCMATQFEYYTSYHCGLDVEQNYFKCMECIKYLYENGYRISEWNILATKNVKLLKYLISKKIDIRTLKSYFDEAEYGNTCNKQCLRIFKSKLKSV